MNITLKLKAISKSGLCSITDIAETFDSKKHDKIVCKTVFTVKSEFLCSDQFYKLINCRFFNVNNNQREGIREGRCVIVQKPNVDIYFS